MDLQGEVMACGYEDVQVMWSILDRSKSTRCNMASSSRTFDSRFQAKPVRQLEKVFGC
uniref:Uncharacterized protein n=1 Tax=Lotus japonicus TaxID=34305 RepID=I3S3V9_LOTJA|nr:unknown [Lotus japonicus]